MKNIMKRLPKEFANVLKPFFEEKCIYNNFQKNLQTILKSNLEEKPKILERFNKIQGVDKEVHQAKYRDEDHPHEVPLFLFRPTGHKQSLPVLYWMHGGGLLSGYAEEEELALADIVKKMECIVVSVDYRLAPEYKFPIPLTDCHVGLEWIFDNATKIKINPNKIVVGGISAGGGLAATLVQLVTDAGKIPITHQFLVYPMLDDKNITQASDDIDDTLVWNRANNLFAWTSYLGRNPGTEDIPLYASAMRKVAKSETLQKLPPTTIFVGDLDLFAEECLAYTNNLLKHRVTCELHIYPGGVHSFDKFLPEASISQQFIEDHDRALKNALYTSGDELIGEQDIPMHFEW